MLNLGTPLLHLTPHERVMRECNRVCIALYEGGRRATPAADLTDEERVALAITRGAPYRVDTAHGRIYVQALIGIADQPGGGYIVAIQQAQPGDTVTLP